MALLGFDTEVCAVVEAFICRPTTITLGDVIELSATLRSTSIRDQHLVVDYVIHHPTAAGTISSKVFKWTNLRIDAGATVTLDKRRRIKAISTRTYQPGGYRLELMVAGRPLAETAFELTLR